MDNYERMRKLAGLPVLNEGKLDNAARYGYGEEGVRNNFSNNIRLYGLYVGLRGSGELHIQFTGDRSECLSQWHDDLKHSYKRGEAVARVVPIGDGSQEAPNVIAESVEVEGGELITEAEKSNEVTPTDDVKDDGPKFKVPSDVVSAISARIAELKRSIEDYDKKGYNDGSVKQDTIDALEKIMDNWKRPDGHRKVQIYFGTLISPITDLFPPKVVKFIHSTGDTPTGVDR